MYKTRYMQQLNNKSLLFFYIEVYYTSITPAQIFYAEILFLVRK